MNLPIICLGIVGFARLAQALGDSIDSGTSAGSAVPAPAKNRGLTLKRALRMTMVTM